jgi:hypothetical protein
MNEEPKRLQIPADLERETQDLLEKLGPVDEPVTVTVGPKSGKVRRNSVCPCNSGYKYKNCCMADVNAGELPRLRTKGSNKKIPNRYEPPRKLSKYSSRYTPPPKGEDDVVD